MDEGCGNSLVKDRGLNEHMVLRTDNKGTEEQWVKMKCSIQPLRHTFLYITSNYHNFSSPTDTLHLRYKAKLASLHSTCMAMLTVKCRQAWLYSLFCGVPAKQDGWHTLGVWVAVYQCAWSSLFARRSSNLSSWDKTVGSQRCPYQSTQSSAG